MANIPSRPPPPEQSPFILRKAQEGLQFRAGQVDHTITVLKSTISGSSFLYRLFSKINLTFESRLIKQLTKEKTQLEGMQNRLGSVTVIPETADLATQKKALTKCLQQMNSYLDDALKGPKETWDLHQAQVIGLTHSLKRVLQESDFSRDTAVAKEKMADEVLQQQAAEALKTNKDPGRAALLTNILDNPGEQNNDINRIGMLTIGKVPFDPSKLKPNEGEYNSFIVARSLKDYIATKGKSVSDATVNELLSLVGQSYLNPLVHPFLSETINQGYAPDGKATEQTANFTLSGSTMVVTRSYATEYKYVGDKPELEGSRIPLKITMQCRYNLQTKKVTFTHSYSFDNKKTTLPTTTRPSEVQLPEAPIKSILQKRLGSLYQ